MAQTMLGMAPAPPGVPSAGPGQKPPEAAGPSPVASGAAQPTPSPGPSGKQTILGVAVPGVAPLNPGIAKPPSTPPPGPMGSHKQTVFGVAVPGVAPLQPGVAKQPSTPPPPTLPSPQPPAAPYQYQPLPYPETPPPQPERSGRGAMIAAASILLVAILLGGLVLVVVLWKGRGPVSASAVVDKSGDEALKLECERCSDGTTASLAGESATFDGGHATLKLATPLRVGDNELAISLMRPGGATEEVSLVVPVQYRVRGDLSGLQKSPPVVSVLVEAMPSTAVVVDGKAVELGAAGTKRLDIDVSSELSGSAGQVEQLERRIPYTITPPDSDPSTGEVTLRTSIVPLVVHAPGESIVVESATFTLAGQTEKGGSLTVAGRPITVDATGRFAQLMNVSSVGETTIAVRADAPKRAPRLFPIKVRRVASLKQEAKRIGGKATRTYSGIQSNVESKRGWAVALEGVVVENRTHNHTSVLLLDVVRGCPARPCLVKVVHGSTLSFDAGKRITVYGQLLGEVEGPRSGTKIPEVRADFALPGGGP